MRLLICFDDSENAGHAIERAGALFPAAHATVAYAWQESIRPGGAALSGQFVLPADIDQTLREQARSDADAIAERGAGIARAAGLAADAVAVQCTGPAWHELLRLAESHDADVIIAGSRGLGGIKSVLLGSVSSALAHHAHRPLLIVPPVTKPLAA